VCTEKRRKRKEKNFLSFLFFFSVLFLHVHRYISKIKIQELNSGGRRGGTFSFSFFSIPDLALKELINDIKYKFLHQVWVIEKIKKENIKRMRAYSLTLSLADCPFTLCYLQPGFVSELAVVHFFGVK